MKPVMWPPKAPEEKIWATFDFRKGLAVGETVVLVNMVVSLKGGVDANPQAILSTQSILGGRVLQRIVDGADDATYQLMCLATTSEGRVLKLVGVLPVREF